MQLITENILNRGAKGQINTSDGADLRKGRKSQFQNNFAATYKTTSRITDSVAIYLPPNVTDSTSVAYNGFATGVVGLANTGGANLIEAMRNNDFERPLQRVLQAQQKVLSWSQRKKQ